MDYFCAAHRIMYFSNPDVMFHGAPTGLKGHADNARAIRASKLAVTNYRQSRRRSP
jgi:hypothetical protein